MRALTGFMHFLCSNSWKLKSLSFAGDAEDWCNSMQCKTLCSVLLGKVCAYLNMHKRATISIRLFSFNYIRSCALQFHLVASIGLTICIYIKGFYVALHGCNVSKLHIPCHITNPSFQVSYMIQCILHHQICYQLIFF